jgi:signal transduction histidine kinase
MSGPGSLRGAAAEAGAIRNRGGLAQRTLLASVALALVAGAGFAILLLPIQKARDAERRALHSQDVMLAANGLEERVLDLETGQRGFILTRQTQFLVPWQQAREQLPQQERALLRLVRGDSAQEARVREIARAAHSYIDDYSAPLVAAAARADPSARTVAATAEGEARMSVIRADFAQLLRAEHRTSAATARASASAAHRAYAGLVLGVGASVVLVAVYAGYMMRAIVLPIRRAATVAGRVAGGDFTARLPETAVGEVGDLQRAFNVMGASLEHGRDELTALADEQAALRRIATLVAHDEPPERIFQSVAEEVGQLVAGVDGTLVGRYHEDRSIEFVGAWSREGTPAHVGERVALGGENVATLVFERDAPARVDALSDEQAQPSVMAKWARSAIGAPINVDGRLWGVMTIGSRRPRGLPAGVERRLADFTELLATAIANAEGRAQLVAARRRVIEATDAARAKLARDIHDGAQQRFLTGLIDLQLAQQKRSSDPARSQELVEHGAAQVETGIATLRELAAGVHPAILRDLGLEAALRALASEMPMQLSMEVNAPKLPGTVESSVYFFCSEALTNVVKHAKASASSVRVQPVDGELIVEVRDNGIGGAELGSGGSGLIGLHDRIGALDGSLCLSSTPGGTGTVLVARIPLPD